MSPMAMSMNTPLRQMEAIMPVTNLSLLGSSRLLAKTMKKPAYPPFWSQEDQKKNHTKSHQALTKHGKKQLRGTAQKRMAAFVKVQRMKKKSKRDRQKECKRCIQGY